MSRAYGVFNAEFGRPDRAIFIIDLAGVIRWMKVYTPGMLPDNAEVLAALEEIARP